MAIKKCKPTTPSRRFMTFTVSEGGTKNQPHTPLLAKQGRYGKSKRN